MAQKYQVRLGNLVENQTEEQIEQERFIIQCEKVCVLIIGAIALAQIVTTTLFFYRSKQNKQITCLPKAMMLMGIVPTVYWFVWSIVYLSGIDDTIFYYVYLAVNMTAIINYGLMFRFIRLQVQLKASQENSRKIMETIERSKKIESFIKADLLIYTLALLVRLLADFIMEKNEIRTKIIQRAIDI